MWEIVGIIGFFLVILASIALHEIGHLVPAKKFGVKVTEYMVGFGPTLWSRRRGETSYGVKAIPVGGYIRMVGMLPPPKDAPEGTARSMSTGRFTMLVEDARRQSLEEIAPGDESRVFYRLPVRQRVIIMLGGPFMNLALAFVLFAIVLVGIGTAQPSLTVSSVVPCVPTVDAPTGSPDASGECAQGASPAALAGLQPGDVITGLSGETPASWDALTDQIRAQGVVAGVLTVVRADGTTVQLPVETAEVTRPVYDEMGEPTGAVETTGFLGVRPEIEYVNQSWTTVPAQMWDLTARSATALASMPVRVYELVSETLVGGGERQIDSPVSVVGVSRLGGEIVASDESPEAKLAIFLSLAASLNLFLFLFNLLPILPLDGGHVAGALYEGSRRSVARVRGRPDPGPVDVARLLPVAYVVAVALVAVGAVVIFADLVKPLTLG
ncbi:MAG: site-2 protease family protein [Candidatus Nanopelagicales bacterium]|jgi:membrane-associated protease RseP (regulator of RpoE activity)|nr:site-2 protease family protein [Candidatus Nanopelagicales bacterium]MDP4905813.1 site-2 protease family protein [Candidatus Nanopelagicales bacterium]MDP4975327.1 site-2 protease family protein [Candidatus Nanopelagicales bacterium]MDP5094289.1 site-2 protease family protein [Candidatus Nanopelagicales bacterium]